MKEKAPTHLISGVFVFLLLGVFAVLSTVMVLLGARAYRGTVERNSTHNTARICSSYLRSIVRADDETGSLRIERMDALVTNEDDSEQQVQVDTIALYNAYDDEAYVTRIYIWDGYLREWFTEASEPFYADAGEVVCAAEEMQASIQDGLLTVEVRSGGETVETNVALYAGGEVDT